LVAEVGRYTIENLILNAVHEIGEWLRFDGLRVFPAHPPSGGPLGNSDGQGNGSVQLTVTFDPPARPSPVFLVPPPVDDLMEIANPSRFTYLPGTSVEYHADGPEIRFRTGDAPTTGWRSTWSPATLDSLRDGADAETLIGAVRSDVHRAVVASEADRICRAFYIDRRRPWRLSAADPRVAAPPIGDDEADGILDLTIAYLNPDVYIG
jgi:hypothetical protein